MARARPGERAGRLRGAAPAGGDPGDPETNTEQREEPHRRRPGGTVTPLRPLAAHRFGPGTGPYPPAANFDDRLAAPLRDAAVAPLPLLAAQETERAQRRLVGYVEQDRVFAGAVPIAVPGGDDEDVAPLPGQLHAFHRRGSAALDRAEDVTGRASNARRLHTGGKPAHVESDGGKRRRAQLDSSARPALSVAGRLAAG